MIVNVRHTGIVVAQLERALEFYCALGFDVFSRDIEKGPFIEQVTGIKGAIVEWVKLKSKDGYLLELLNYNNESSVIPKELSPSNQMGISHIAYTVKDINQACELIVSLGGTLVNAPAQAPNNQVKVAYCYDLEGVLMEIVEVLS